MKKKTVVPDPTVWDRIKAKQIEMNALFREAIDQIFKETEGAAFLGEDNVSFVTYWLAAVQEHPKVMDGLYNAADFAVKETIFRKLVVAYNDYNVGRAIMDESYDILSQDLLRYAMDAKLKFDEVAGKDKGTVYKQVCKDAPQYRKPPKTKTAAVATTEVPVTP